MAQFRPKQLAHLDPKSVAQIRPFYPLLSLFGYRGNQFHPAVMIGLQHKNILCHSEFFGVGKITGYPHSIYNHSKQPQSIRIKLLYLLFINGFYRVD